MNVARDLASHSPNIASLQVSFDDQQALSVQFEKLVIEPMQRFPPIGPQVLIFDAIDEARNNTEFLQILRNDVPRLPCNFRVFVTSRNEPAIRDHFEPPPTHISFHPLLLHLIEIVLVKIEIFDRVTADDQILIRVHPRVSYAELMESVHSRLGDEISILPYRDSVNKSFVGLSSDQDLRIWMESTDNHVLLYRLNEDDLSVRLSSL